ncbi:MAG: hypothetical protein QOD13_172 [Thermoleophilaceae bacterium]|nr:hypothetical protein [Thermoleophilaceae bacterium]
MYSGMSGPGTFEIVRLNRRGLATARAATPRSGSGSSPSALSTVPAPSGRPSRLKASVERRMRARRDRPLARSSGSGTNANEIRLPSARAWSSGRTFTGTIALSGRGTSPRESAAARSAPAASARQTSFTVDPAARLTSRTSWRSTTWRTSARLGPMRAFSAEAGAGRRRSSPAASAARLNVPAIRDADARGSPAMRAAPRAARRDSSAPSATTRAASLVAPGAGGASHGTGSSATPFGSTSKSSWATSTAERPSTRAWWILTTSPQRPPDSRGARRISHSGRPRSSGADSTLSQSNSKRWSSSSTPSVPSESTWFVTSKSGSSTQKGSPMPGGGHASRQRKRGTRSRRPAMWRRSRVSVGRDSPAATRNVALHATCM